MNDIETRLDAYHERFKAYETQFEVMDKDAEKLEIKVRELEIAGLKIAAERDAIVQYTTDLIARLKGQTNETNKTNPVCETQDTSPTILEDRRGETESQNAYGISPC